MDKTSKNKQHKQKSFGNREIDFSSLLKALWKKLWLILLVGVVCGGLTYVGSKAFITPTYRSGFTAYVNNKKGMDLSALSSSDVVAAQALAHTYSEIITGRSVLESAAKNAGVNYSYGKLKNEVSVVISSDTEIIEVYVEDPNPETAYRLAQEIMNSSVSYATQIVEGSSMKIIDLPEIPGGIYKPSYTRLTIIGAVAGMAVIIFIICLRQIFNDKVRSEADLESRYSIPIVGVIPDMININKLKGKEGYYAYYGQPADEPADGNKEKEADKK